jgi:outer membrane lipase/esterase
MGGFFQLNWELIMSKSKQFINFIYSLVYLGLTLFISVTNANATTYNLGDSLSDAGALGFTYTNPVSIKPLSEGKVWVQYLSNSIPAFCDDNRHCKFNNETYYYSDTGNNYAVGGAGVTFDSTDARLARNFTNLHAQIEALTHNHKLTSEDIVTVWMGANDVFAATADPYTSADVVKQTGEIFKSELKKLAKFGAKIYVITIPDLGQTPLGLYSSDGGRFLTELTEIFNSEISSLARVKNISLIDSNALFALLVASGDFDNSDIYCGAIIDPKHICGNKRTNPAIPNNSDLPFIYADPVHPSNAVHKWIADTLQKLIQ